MGEGISCSNPMAPTTLLDLVLVEEDPNWCCCSSTSAAIFKEELTLETGHSQLPCLDTRRIVLWPLFVVEPRLFQMRAEGLYPS